MMMNGSYEFETVFEPFQESNEWPSRWWEPGAEDAADNILPESEWLPEDLELPFM